MEMESIVTPKPFISVQAQFWMLTSVLDLEVLLDRFFNGFEVALASQDDPSSNQVFDVIDIFLFVLIFVGPSSQFFLQGVGFFDTTLP